MSFRDMRWPPPPPPDRVARLVKGALSIGAARRCEAEDYDIIGTDGEVLRVRPPRQCKTCGAPEQPPTCTYCRTTR